MYGKHWRSLVVGTALLACRRLRLREEWQTWRSNTSHFASKEHFDFSMKNRGELADRDAVRTSPMAQQQNWFGRAVTVDQGQILER
jgi:hypothetical protein